MKWRSAEKAEKRAAAAGEAAAALSASAATIASQLTNIVNNGSYRKRKMRKQPASASYRKPADSCGRISGRL